MSPQASRRTFGVLLAILLATIVAELVGTSRDDAELRPTPPAAAPMGPAVKAPTPAAMTNVILARPLFSVDRRPEPGDNQSAGVDASGNLPRLAGILMAPEGKRALFQSPGADRPIVLGEGETIGGWRVKDIDAAAVTLVGALGTRRLEPKFDPNAKPGMLPNAGGLPGAMLTPMAVQPPMPEAAPANFPMLPAPAAPRPVTSHRGQ